MNQKPTAGNKGDVSYLRATPGPNMVIAPSPVPGRDNTHTPGAPQPQNVNSDLEDKLELQQRELDEVRARAAQMEKTMRWWSDCTANWREKWSKVRNERNKSREENRQLRAKLDSCIKEMNILKRDKDDLLNKDSQKVKILDKHVEVESGVSPTSNNSLLQASCINNDLGTNSDSLEIKQDSKVMNNLTELNINEETDSVQTDFIEAPLKVSPGRMSNSLRMKDDGSVSEGSVAEDKLALLELKLEETQKTIFCEREVKASLVKSNEDSQLELKMLRVKYEEMKQSKLDLALQFERLKDQHKEDLSRVSVDLTDEVAAKSGLEKRLIDIRFELEKLQKENADEWGKRERLETEKIGMDRDNKKLHAQIKDLEEQLERKSTHASTVVNKDLKTLHMELSDKNKELSDLRHSHTKLKKTLQEHITELDHSKRRCEQFEIEVKKLRSRIDELRRELTAAEDEADAQTNNVRKIQRTNDELQEQSENLQVQVEHLQSRLRRSTQPGGGQASSVWSHSSDLQALEIDDDTDDDFSEGN